MNFKAIVYNTQNGKPMETTVRCIFCDKNGKPVRVQAHNGINYNEFHIWDNSQPSKWSDHKIHDQIK